MLIELAIGDAYGAGFEFVDQQTIELYNILTATSSIPITTSGLDVTQTIRR